MTHLSVFILIATVVIGLTCSYEYYYFDDKHKKAFGSMIATFIMLFLFSFVFIKVGWLPDFLDVKNVNTELISDKKQLKFLQRKRYIVMVITQSSRTRVDIKLLLIFTDGIRKFIITAKERTALKLMGYTGTQPI